MTRVCCVCNRIEEDGAWILPQGPVDGRVSHGFCPACYRRMLAAVEAEARALAAAGEEEGIACGDPACGRWAWISS